MKRKCTVNVRIIHEKQNEAFKPLLVFLLKKHTALLSSFYLLPRWKSWNKCKKLSTETKWLEETGWNRFSATFALLAFLSMYFMRSSSTILFKNDHGQTKPMLDFQGAYYTTDMIEIFGPEIIQSFFNGFLFLFQRYGDRLWPLIIFGSLMFIPGSYHVFIAVQTFRGVRGYSFDEFPSFDWRNRFHRWS